MMKKIIVIALMIVSGFAFAQNSSDNPFIYDNSNISDNSSNLQQEDSFPNNPGDPNTAPIDEYIPMLLIVATVLIFIHSKWKTAEKG